MAQTSQHDELETPLQWEEVSAAQGMERHWQLKGPLDARQGSILKALLRLPRPSPGGTLCVNLAGVTHCDGAGAAFFITLWRRAQEEGHTIALRQVPEGVQSVLALYRFQDTAPEPPPPPGALETLGENAWLGWHGLKDFVILAADVSVQAATAVLRPWTLRWSAVTEQSILMGSRALGIVGLINFLVGLTLAFQSAYQLRQFGAAIYTATLTAISMVREMGPLITAILVAGRSGSSITSEVATMKVNEEIDAMQVMGISFTEYVAVPKVLALLAMMPLLTILADVLGIAGGLVVGIGYLDLSVGPYLAETLDSLDGEDLATGLFKSLAFAWGIALIGLFYGMRVRGGAQEVGQATTASVVTAIFFIIVADSVFSILFYMVI